MVNIDGEAAEGAQQRLRARSPSLPSGSNELARARLRGANTYLPQPERSSSAAQERWPAVRVEPRHTSARAKAREEHPPLAQADLKKITASPSIHQDSKSPISDIFLPTKQAHISEGGDQNSNLAGHDRGAPQDETCPPDPQPTSKQAST